MKGANTVIVLAGLVLGLVGSAICEGIEIIEITEIRDGFLTFPNEDPSRHYRVEFKPHLQPWADAIAYCHASDFAGHSDWRLPNVRELHSLVDFGEHHPALPAGHAFNGIQTDVYWTSTTHAEAADVARTVDLASGAVRNRAKMDASYLWPVRQGIGPDNPTQMVWSVTQGSLPPGWYDTLEDAAHGVRIIAYAGTENPDPYFRIKVDTRISNRVVSASDQIFIGIQQTTGGTGANYGNPTSNTGFDFEIDWGDGTVAHLTDADRTQIPDVTTRWGFLHTYAAPGIYEIAMKGEIPYWTATPDEGKWMEISNWGPQALKATRSFLSGSTRLQIVGNALIYPPVTPNVIRWERALQLCRSDYHPAYDTRSAQLLDRMFYLASLKRAPLLDTGECRNFHNFFRSARGLEGAVPHYDTRKGEFFYRFFREASALRTEDIPLLDTSQGRVFEGMFADLPLVERIPDGYDFSKAGTPFSASTWVPYAPHRDTVPNAFNLFAGGFTGDLGVSRAGADSGLASIDNLDINTPANAHWAFYRNSGLQHVTDLDITIGGGFRLFNRSQIESVQGAIRLHPDPVTEWGSLGYAFANCAHLISADLVLPGWTMMHLLFSETPIKHLRLEAPQFTGGFNSLVEDPTTLESLELPNWASTVNFSIANSAMDRDAILALVDSLPTRTDSVSIDIAGAAGAGDITQADKDAAAAKGWVLATD